MSVISIDISILSTFLKEKQANKTMYDYNSKRDRFNHGGLLYTTHNREFADQHFFKGA